MRVPTTALKDTQSIVGSKKVGSGWIIAPREINPNDYNNSTTMDDEEKQQPQVATQAVLAFTMSDWKRLCLEHFTSGEQGDLPHRTSHSSTTVTSTN